MNDFLSRFDDPIPLMLGKKVEPKPAVFPMEQVEWLGIRFIDDERVNETDQAHPAAPALRYYSGLHSHTDPLGRRVHVLERGAPVPAGCWLTTLDHYQSDQHGYVSNVTCDRYRRQEAQHIERPIQGLGWHQTKDGVTHYNGSMAGAYKAMGIAWEPNGEDVHVWDAMGQLNVLKSGEEWRFGDDDKHVIVNYPF